MMTENNSFAVFRRTVNDRYQMLRQALDGTLQAFSGGNEQQRKETTTHLATVAKDFHDILSDQDRPDWLNPILNAARTYAANSSRINALGLLKIIAEQYYHVRPIDLEQEEESPYDFDTIFERLRTERRVPELFDELVERITQIIKSGEIDSVVVLSSLEQMLAVLKANRNASYGAMIGTFDYVKFVARFIRELLKRIPGIKEAIEAFEKTLSKTEEEIQGVQQDLRDQMQAAILERLPNLKRLPEIADQQRLELPAPNDSQTNSE